MIAEDATARYWAGKATHLGKITVESYYFQPLGDGRFIEYFQKTAANGDHLDGYTIFDPALGTYTLTYMGGTGRFSDAQGAATVTAIDPGPPVTIRIVGWISY
ncbi:MAG: hypothetical protein L0Z62_46180 [Gemmataceae bacterium]|nr:hypothetical protein [Gemmataceae bacterium]